MIKKLILVRHGQSTYNLENRFTGWKDVDLTEKGKGEAVDGGIILRKNNIIPDIAYTSNLKRAQNTLSIILEEMNIDIPILKNIALNERDYGSLIGQNKDEAALEFGADQVQIWRRSYDTPPPNGESLKMTCDRVLPYLKSTILASFSDNNNILISAHGNSIRAIVMELFNYNSEEILKTEIGWCEPWVFTFENNKIIDFKIYHPDNETNSKLPKRPTF
tara:strand:- start:210 stop:866 length:657 start_codon:yes stop_codon:yes gene_type:complete